LDAAITAERLTAIKNTRRYGQLKGFGVSGSSLRVRSWKDTSWRSWKDVGLFTWKNTSYTENDAFTSISTHAYLHRTP
jgi:hypothetical protein